MLEVANISRLPHLTFAALDAEDRLAEVVVAKATFELVPEPTLSGGTSLAPRFTPTRTVLSVTDDYFGPVNRSSVRTESDLAPFKPRCDVIVIGSAHSPTGDPVASVEVALTIQRNGAVIHQHALRVHGERELVRRDLLDRGAAAMIRFASVGTVRAPDWVLSPAKPFMVCPLRYELAFGGEIRVETDDPHLDRLEDANRLSPEARQTHPDQEKAPAAHRASPANPLGRGFVEPWFLKFSRADRYPAPRIEAAQTPFSAESFDVLAHGGAHPDADSALIPHGFGVITKAWQPRLALAGTFDAEWRTSRWPNLPRDFDMAYWNGAHPAMQCVHLRGGEIVELKNLLPRGAQGNVARSDGLFASFRVPEFELALRIEHEDERVSFGLLPIDTLVVDLESMHAHVVWRMRVPADMPLRSATLLSLVEFRNRYAAEIAASVAA